MSPLYDGEVVLGTHGQKPPCSISINHLPDEILLEIFDCCRLADLSCWNHKRQWQMLSHVCRRWWYIIFESTSRLKLRLLCDSRTGTEKMLIHSPPLPLIVDCTYFDYMTIRSHECVLHGLEHTDRVFSIILDSCSLSEPDLPKALDKTYPILEVLSLQSLEDHDVPMLLPDNFATPRLRALHLYTIPPEEISSLLTTPITANLITLRLDRIEEFSFVPPEHLAELISCMPKLENLSIGFNPTYPLSDGDREFWHTEMRRVVLPSLWSLTFTGESAYLDKILALINTPLLRCFHVTYSPKPPLTVQALLAFVRTIQNLDFRTAVVLFSGTVAVTYYPEKPSDSPSYLKFTMDSDDKIDRLNGQVTTMSQICATLAPALRVVENLALEVVRPYVPDDFAVRREHWHTFLRSLGALKTLRVDVTLTPELSCILSPDNTYAEELLALLSELVVVSRIDLARNPFDSLIHTRNLAGHNIDFRVIRRHPLPPPPLTILRSPDAFECSI